MPGFSGIERGKRGLFARAMDVKDAGSDAQGSLAASRDAAGQLPLSSILESIAADSSTRACASGGALSSGS